MKIECIPLILVALLLGGCMVSPAPGTSGKVDGGILSGGVETEWETAQQPSARSTVETNTYFIDEIDDCKVLSGGSDACLCYANIPKEYLALDAYYLNNCPHTIPTEPPDNVREVEKDNGDPFDQPPSGDSPRIPADGEASVEDSETPDPASGDATFNEEQCLDKGNKHPFCIAKLELKAHKWLLDAVRRGCEYIEGKDAFYGESGKTYHCSIVASDVLNETIMAPLEY